MQEYKALQIAFHGATVRLQFSVVIINFFLFMINTITNLIIVIINIWLLRKQGWKTSMDKNASVSFPQAFPTLSAHIECNTLHSGMLHISFVIDP